MRTLVIVAALSVASVAFERQQQPADPPNRSHRLEDLTWVDAEAVMTQDAVVVLPFGGASQPHGPHLPLRTDGVLAQYLTDRVAEATPVLVAPMLTYSHNPALLEYPGATSLSSSVARDLVADIARSLARHGPRRFYAISASGFGTGPLAAAARLLQAEGILLRYTDVSAHLDRTAGAIQQQQNGDHAGEIETSMMLHVDARQVDMSKAVKEDSPASSPLVFTRRPDRPGTYSPSGIWGDAALATRRRDACSWRRCSVEYFATSRRCARRPCRVRPPAATYRRGAACR